MNAAPHTSPRTPSQRKRSTAGAGPGARRRASRRPTENRIAEPVTPSAPAELGPNFTPPPQHPLVGWQPLSERAYRADPCPTPSLSSHVAILAITKSLLHAWRAHPRSPDHEDSVSSAAADRGSAAHALLFGEDRIVAIDADDYRTLAAREARDAARAAGNVPLLTREIDPIREMVAAASVRFSYLHAGPYACEQSAIWKVGLNGWRRARLDTISEDRRLIVDYKTTNAGVDAHSCERRISEMGLQIQAAAYVDAVESLHPEMRGRVRFVFQWQEQSAPYALSPPIEMSDAFLSLGRAQWKAAGELWDLAMRQQAYPSYPASPFLACPPPWELSRWEERERMLAETLDERALMRRPR